MKDKRPKNLALRLLSAGCASSLMAMTLVGCNSSSESNNDTPDVVTAPDPAPVVRVTPPPTAAPRPVEEANVVPSVSVIPLSGPVAQNSAVVINSLASDRDGSITRYEWRQIGGSTVTMNGSTGASLSFTAPNASTGPSAASDNTLIFELTVWDDKGASARASVTVPLSDGDAPVANAGEDQVVAQLQEVILDAGDSTDLNGNIVSYAWRQTRGEPAEDFFNTNNEEVRFTSPDTFRTVDMEFELTVTDNEGNTATDSVTITLLGELEETLQDEDNFFTFPNRTSEQFAANAAEGEAYYRTVDPNNERTTLDDWYAKNGFIIDFENPNYFQACYINGADLGFARAMRIRQNDNGDISSTVENFLTLEEACRNIETGDRTGLLAAVSMEFTRPDGDDDGERRSTFYVYQGIDGDTRVPEVDLDGRGPKAVPGLCNVCHGGEPQDVVAGVFPDDGNSGAFFLPWNLNTFIFLDQPGFTQADQEEQLREMNRLALGTVPQENNFIQSDTGSYTGDALRELVEGWYGGPGLPRSTFDGDFVPAGWIPEIEGGDEGVPYYARDLYLDVIEPNCSVCHLLRGTDHEDRVDFDSYEKFMEYKDLTIDYVFKSGIMPGSLLTTTLFWSDEGVEGSERLGSDDGIPDAVRLAAALGYDPTGQIDDGLGDLPGKPVADIAAPSEAPRAFPIQLSAQGSNFEAFYDWELISQPAGSNAQLVGATTVAPVLNADIEGEYQVRLIVGNDNNDLSLPITATINVIDALEPVSFQDDIFIMLQNSCASLCHNRNGFEGIPVEFDNAATAHEFFVQYVNFEDPTDSPVLRKPSGNYHRGGIVGGFDLEGDRSNYDLVLRWILEGAEAN